ncbi:MAG: G/U mismatch-specific DNA glycosylase [Gemmataceae bacterium]|nr:G/U mismatch-specific DNA glycosylase [Gemmataceae bacterium]
MADLPSFRPTRAELLAAHGAFVPDILAPDLRVLFCGINPGLYTAAIGHHFGRPGNRFWPTLHAAGFTDRILSPYEEQELLAHGYGITNVVARATATAAELTSEELIAGRQRLLRKVRRYHPRFLAVLGVGAYREGWKEPKAVLGLQPKPIAATKVWVLPNPSGLNAHYHGDQLAGLFRELREAVDAAHS